MYPVCEWNGLLPDGEGEKWISSLDREWATLDLGLENLSPPFVSESWRIVTGRPSDVFQFGLPFSSGIPKLGSVIWFRSEGQRGQLDSLSSTRTVLDVPNHAKSATRYQYAIDLS